MASRKTAIVTGASQGIGAAVVRAFLDRGYNVVATALGGSEASFGPSSNLLFVNGDIGEAATAEKVTQTAISKFGSIDHVVNRGRRRLRLRFMGLKSEGCGALDGDQLTGSLMEKPCSKTAAR
jgi:NAD(P)-dependent dehydrogenase (short-subunit alcohol dehydrogenase family)